jgi:serine/threonine protein kinase
MLPPVDARSKPARFAPQAQAAPSDPEGHDDTGPFRVGQVLGGAYTITSVLGAGGMGIVYEAHDGLLDRSVAIKAPLSPELAPMLRNEAQAMAAVHHPNLVTVYAAARQGDVEYLVMERVFGMTLEDRIAEAWSSERPIPIDEVVDLLHAIADAVTAIHRAGASHRDIKSANVMLSGSRVVLTDFGLVMPEVAVHSGGPIAGSADYMAPELILGSVSPGHGPQVDLYALGVVAFELLAGRRPFPFESSQAVLLAHVTRRPPDLHTLRSDVPDELAALVAELLAKTPDDRPEDAEVVLWRLDAIRADLPAGSAEEAPLSVLIVDDAPEAGRAIRRNLQWSLPRLTAEHVEDAEEALARLRHKTPDVLLVDLDRGRIDGVELCMEIGAMPAHDRPLVIARSAQAMVYDIDVLRRLGVYAFAPEDERFIARMCKVLSEVRRAKHGQQAPRPARRSHRPR